MDRPPAPRPADELVDGFGRVHRDLRISVTDRCDFRCTYCMPEEGLPSVPRDQVLTYEEIGRIARVLVERYGITSIRLTGGEPTVRARLSELVALLAPLGTDLSMTTNGASLERHAADLRAAGLRRINVSLDSLRPERFAEMTRRDALDKVLRGIDAAVAAGFSPVKVNVVLVAGVNDDEILDFAEFGRSRGVTVRFIEFMPLDADGHWDGSEVVGRDQVLAALSPALPLEPVVRGHEPAERYRYLDREAGSAGSEIGIIPSVTTPFCDSCDRIRLTAEGELRNCLFSVEETDLRAVLRGGGTDAELAEAIRRCVASKRAGHGIGTPTFIRPGRSMSQIGG
ncbi:GTP 3',8-cyclase MoaA [Dermatobacter hominis]|uniref:GTP 3',8-cyclase MoaA n=1 Tax=Dermatobacter hominis TaxID=2884263 RepID=UPI001D104FE6|nr:GTP 3',8-cyclase MoaA [Dermatobacter hominis]UDY37870.1 GTP 3',8-cyclase MoaA [Dermatobacter hominis]